MYSSHKMKVVVRRASQVHQIPHTGRAHSGPVISPIEQMATPTSAADTASQSQRGWRVARYAMFAKNTMKKALNGVHRLFIRRDVERGIRRIKHERGQSERCCDAKFHPVSFYSSSRYSHN